MKRSVEAGKVVTLTEMACAIDGLKVRRVGQHTFQIVRDLVDSIVTLDDAAIFDAVLWTMSRCKLVVEGAAAAPVAALLAGRVDAPPGSKVVCVLSGGNVDLERLRGQVLN
jgi:threonine dehydratase